MHWAVVSYQVNRFKKDYRFFFEREESKETVEFFFEKIYALEGKEHRDALTRRTFANFQPFITMGMKQKVKRLFLLNDLTDFLDLKMAKTLQKMKVNSKQITKKNFEIAYKKCGYQSERKLQTELVIENFTQFFDFSRKPIIRAIMPIMFFLAKRLSAQHLVAIFQDGYKSSQKFSKETFYSFIDFVKVNEAQYQSRLFNT